MNDFYSGEYLGTGPFRREWVSFCSRHRFAQENCQQCMKGYYANVLNGNVQRLAFRIWPNGWRWWANRNREKL